MPNVAIITTVVPATDTRQTRIRCASGADTSLVPWDYALGAEDNHLCAAIAHADRFGITGELVHASLPHDRGYAFLALSADAVSLHL